MKEKIMYLIIGLLIGAIITAACFMIFNKKDNNGMPEGGPGGQMQMDGNNMGGPGGNGEKPNGMPGLTNSTSTSTDSSANNT